MYQNKGILLSTAYFAPVHYFTKLVQFKKGYLEQFENFTKQTYRNRCEILGANGPVSLIVPVVKGRGRKIKIKDLRISYDTEWQRNHWRTIFSAYNSSPFFEFYQDDIRPFFEQKRKYLFDLNGEIHETICDLLEMENNLVLTDNFEKVPENTANFREAFSPKKQKAFPDPDFQPQKYTQVFSEKLDFVPNLSILDLLFNEGPNSFNILEKSCPKAQQ
jgi:hypothetical protein